MLFKLQTLIFFLTPNLKSLIPFVPLRQRKEYPLDIRGFKLLISLYLTLSSLSLFAQSNGEIKGYIREAKTGSPIPGATVQLEGTTLGAISNSDGYYVIESVPAATYTLKASFVGYITQMRYGVIVRSGGIPDVNFSLEESFETLDEIVFTANPFEKEEVTPLSIQKLNAEEIAAYPGGNNDIAKVVQSLPGVSGSIGGFRNDIIIRGGAPNENVYYLDGIEIPNINHFATQGSAGGPVGLLNVSFFNGVTLSTSAFPSMYDNVLSGVLQFDQRTGNQEKLKTNFRLGSSEAALTFEGPLFKKDKEDKKAKTTFIASVRRSYLQFLFEVIGLPFLPDYWDFQYKINHEFDAYNSLSVTGVGSIDDFRINVPDEFDAEQQATLDRVPVIQQKTNTIGVTWKNRFKNDKGLLQVSLSTNRLSNNFRQFRDNESQTGLFLQNDAIEQETKLRVLQTFFKGQWTLKLSKSFQRVSYKNSSLNLVDNFNFESDINFIKYGASVQASRISQDQRWSVALGYRIDGNTFTEDGNKFLNQFSPRVSASYTFDTQRKWSINASTGIYYKIPPYTILGFRDENGLFLNQNAEYIQSFHAVSGLEYLVTPSSRFTLEAFYKKYNNYPVSLIDSVSLANLGADFSVLGNEPIASVGLGRSYGLEFLYQKKFTNDYYAILAYTLFWSEFTGFDTEEFLPSAWDSRHLLTFTGGYQFGKNWEISARMRFVGKTPFAPVDQNETLQNYPAVIFDYSQLGEARINAFNQTDIRIDKKFNFEKWTLNVFLEVQNVLGQTIPQPPEFGLNRNEQGQIIDPRTLIEVSEIDNSATLPSIGVIIDF